MLEPATDCLNFHNHLALTKFGRRLRIFTNMKSVIQVVARKGTEIEKP